MPGWRWSNPPNTQFRLNHDSPQARGLVAWWPFGQSTLLRDLSGQQNATGTMNLAVSERGYVFNPATGTITVADNGRTIANGGLQAGSGSFTLAVWSYLPTGATSANAELFSKLAGAGTAMLRINLDITSSARWESEINDGTSGGYWLGTVNPSIIVGGWHHISVVVERNGVNDILHIYYDGRLSESISRAAVGSITNNGSAGLGMSAAAAGRWPGYLSDMRIWSRALSPAEIWQLYANPWELYELLVPVWSVGWAAAPVATGNPRYAYAQQ